MLIGGVDDELKAKLRLRAAKHGISMEKEVRRILSAELSVPDRRNEEHPVHSIRRWVDANGGGVDAAFRRTRALARAPKFD